MRGLYDYVKMITIGAMTTFEQISLTKHSYKDYSATNDRSTPPIMNKIFMLRNMPYTLRNSRDLNS